MTVPVLSETDQERAAMVSARSRGYAAGFAEGRRAAAAEQERWLAAAEEARAVESARVADRVAVLASALHAAAVELREATVPVLAEAGEVLIDSAFELASAVVGAALDERLTAARAAVGRVVSAGAPGAVPIVRLHPDDVAALLDAGEPGDGMQLIADSSLSRGDAIGELPTGWLDARIHSALERAKEALA
jgi:flagellar assembly protein FliH